MSQKVLRKNEWSQHFFCITYSLLYRTAIPTGAWLFFNLLTLEQHLQPLLQHLCVSIIIDLSDMLPEILLSSSCQQRWCQTSRGKILASVWWRVGMLDPSADIIAAFCVKLQGRFATWKRIWDMHWLSSIGIEESSADGGQQSLSKIDLDFTVFGIGY